MIVFKVAQETFILDLGYNFNQNLKINPTNATCVIITHEHGDHIEYLNRFLELNKKCQVVISKELMGFVDDKTRVKRDNVYKNWMIHDYDIVHDCIKNTAYIFEEKTNTNNSFAYLTDAKEINESFANDIILKNVKTIFIECNHDLDFVNKKIKEDRDGLNLKYLERTKETHLNSLQVLEFLKKIKTTKLKRNVILTHQSPSNMPETSKKIFNADDLNINLFFAKKDLMFEVE